MIHTILIVDDEINSLRVLSAALQNDNLQVETARSGEEAFEALKRRKFDLVISDYKMPGMNGEQLLEKTSILYPEIPFIILTAFGTIEMAVDCMRKGAYTYLTKPDLLENLVSEVLGARKSAIAGDKSNAGIFLNIIGKAPAMQEVFSLIRRVSKTDANILILGESGTGKELVARAIHYNSLRKDNPFIPIDCTTIPSELMESELFGHEKGAFTNANDRKIGLIEMAQKGTVFLDEIGDLDFPLEKKLLRFLQEKDILRVGGKQRISIDVRVLSATNLDIEKEVEEGRFRADLYYRLNVISIRIPPLRKRKEDIPLIANHYLTYFNQKNNKQIRGMDEEVRQALQSYDWPGNVRELENVMERAVILCPLDTINIECLPKKLRENCGEEINGTLELNLPAMEKKIILRALDKVCWNQSQASVVLGISRKQLRTKMKNHDLLK
ncbi:MAG: sigma-54 dependent transcriptional regulator [Deltaproteobacteria bacterium]